MIDENELRAVLKGMPAADTPCPPEAALVALYDGSASPDEADALREHLAACPACVARAREAQAFVRALRSPSRAAVPRWALAAAAVLVGVSLLVIWRSSPPSPVTAPQVAIHQDLEVEKAPYTPTDGGGLVWRGGEEEEETLKWAMEPYVASDYGTAVDRLERRLRAHPEDDRARFYLGVSYLLGGRPQDALPPLRRVAAASSELSDETAWYLALASLKSGDVAAARPILARIASTPGARSEQAREWLREIDGRSP